jgi:hypothetical protein
LFEHCKFANERPKRNCARLAFYRDFNLLDSYTIESSCFGYIVKGIDTEKEEPTIEQLTPSNFVQFGKELL